MYTNVWFTKPEHGDMELLLISGLSSTTADRLVEALSEEFTGCKFWVE